MSTTTEAASRRVDAAIGAGTFRLLALGGVLVLTASIVSVLTDVTAIVGGTRRLLTTVVLMLAAATLLAHTIDERTATVGALALGALGFAYYLSVSGIGVGAVVSATDKLLSDTVALATGLSLLRMVAAGVWTLGFAPAPVFLSWYLALRRRYVLSVIPGGLALLFLALTGDAPVGVTLAGTLGGIAAVGFGELERREGSILQADVLAVLFAAMIVLSMTVTLVPAGTAGPTFLVDEGYDGTVEGSLTSSPDRAFIGGNVSLSPEVRFTVRSEEPSYWRVGVYDRFAGDGWFRTGSNTAYDGQLPPPPGDAETVRQTVFVENEMEVMPAAPYPVSVEGDARENTEVSAHGQIRPDVGLLPGDTYNVESAVLDDSPEAVRGSGVDYPQGIEDRYLQMPEGTSDEFAEYTREVIAGANDPYDEAVAIEEHLRESKEYSLEVDRPDGNVAEAFLLEMDAGYCVYFATTMTQMLREADVPARYAVGYTTGQEVDDNEWVVRGLNAHAWVEAYFPDHGWVAFDPTPGGPRDDVRADRVEEARESGVAGVDTNRSEDVPVDGPSNETPIPDPPDPDENGSPTAPNETPTDPGNGSGDGQSGLITPEEDPTTPAGNGSTSSDGSSSLPDGENVALGLAILVGVAAGAHRTGMAAYASRTARLHWQGRRRDPETDVERAYRRLELLLERRYRPRRPSESSREYIDRLSRRFSLDPGATDVRRTYERAVYGDGVDRKEADRAIDAVDAMASDGTPVLGHLRQ